MIKKERIIAVAGLALAIAAGAVSGVLSEITPEAGQEDSSLGSSENALTEAGKKQTGIDLGTGPITVTGTGADVSGTTVTITQPGRYFISGSLENGQVCVDAGKEDTVVLSLGGMELFNPDDAAIYIKNARQVVLLLEDGTVNRIQSGAQVDPGAMEDVEDSSFSGGVCVINGGTVLAVGDSGMAKTFDAESEQCSFRHNFDRAFASGSEIIVSDAKGNILIRHTAVKKASSVVFSSPELKLGETYTLSVNEDSVLIEQSSVSVSSGASASGQERQKFYF